MKTTQKGSLAWLVALIVALALAVGIYAYSENAAAPTLPTIPPAQPSQPVQPTSPPATPQSSVPTITSISPASGSTGITATLTGSGFLSTNTVLFGGGPVNTTTVTNNGTILTFTIPSSVGADCKPNQACPMYARLITDGIYTVSVRNANGTSGSVSFTVTGGTVLTPQ